MQPKNSTFAERQAASAAAKQALLAKFKPKPYVPAPDPIDHEAERLARVEEIRRKRQEEKEARQLARVEAERRAEEERLAAERQAELAKVEAQLSTDAQKRAERKARKKAIKEAARTKKEIHALNRPSEEERAERKRRYEWERERA